MTFNMAAAIRSSKVGRWTVHYPNFLRQGQGELITNDRKASCLLQRWHTQTNQLMEGWVGEKRPNTMQHI